MAQAQPSARRRLLSGGILVGGGQIAAYGFSFLRSIILANALGPANMGIAALFMLTLAFLEQSSNFSIVKLVVQSPRGNRPSFVRTAHSFELARGALLSMVLFAFAKPLAELFNEPQTFHAFQLLALVPLIQASANLDFARQQRALRYRPTMLYQTLPLLVGLLTAGALAFWLRDWRAALVVYMVQPLTGTVVSHIVAQRPWRLGWTRAYLPEFMRFGAPLLLNGLLLFSNGQGDRLLIGGAFPSEMLGLYFIAANLSWLPFQLLISFSSTLLLAPLGQSSQDPSRYRRRARLTLQTFCGTAPLVAIPFILVGDLVMTIYGAAFAAAGVFVSWLAIMNGLRFMRAGVNLLALARADSMTILLCNVLRLGGFLGAIVAVWLERSLIEVIFAGIGGELLAIAFAVIRLRQHHGLKLTDCLYPMLLAAGWFSAAMVMNQLGMLSNSPWIRSGETAVILLAAAGTMLIALPGLREEAKQILQIIRKART